MTRHLLAFLVVAVVMVGCGSKEPAAETATSTTPADTSMTGKKGAELGSTEATPLMSNADADKRLGSAGGK